MATTSCSSCGRQRASSDDGHILYGDCPGCDRDRRTEEHQSTMERLAERQSEVIVYDDDQNETAESIKGLGRHFVAAAGVRAILGTPSERRKIAQKIYEQTILDLEFIVTAIVADAEINDIKTTFDDLINHVQPKKYAPWAVQSLLKKEVLSEKREHPRDHQAYLSINRDSEALLDTFPQLRNSPADYFLEDLVRRILRLYPDQIKFEGYPDRIESEGYD